MKWIRQILSFILFIVWIGCTVALAFSIIGMALIFLLQKQDVWFGYATQIIDMIRE